MEIGYDYDYYPFYAKKPDIKYRIENPEIANINSKGEINGLNIGTTSVQLVEGEKVVLF